MTENPVRSVDFGTFAPDALDRAILALLARRANPMREREICRWFRATSEAVISVNLTSLVGRQQISARRTGVRRWVLEYSIPGRE